MLVLEQPLVLQLIEAGHEFYCVLNGVFPFPLASGMDGLTQEGELVEDEAHVTHLQVQIGGFAHHRAIGLKALYRKGQGTVAAPSSSITLWKKTSPLSLRPADLTKSMAAKAAARPPFISVVPKPWMTPSTSAPLKGSKAHSFRSP